jgi:hypothetical protein
MYYCNIIFIALFTGLLAYANEVPEYTIGITLDTTNQPYQLYL